LPNPSTTVAPYGVALQAAAHRLAVVLGVLLLLLVSTTPLFVVADLPAAERGTLAAVFPPGTAKPAALAAVVKAGGLVVREGAWGTVLVVHSDKSGFAGRLRRAGAWLVMDPRSTAGCLVVGRINSFSEG
jgi:hypothetical protein